jgi:hypothetical protein
VTGVTEPSPAEDYSGSVGGKEEELPVTSLPITRDPPRSLYPVLRTRNFATGWLHGVATDRNLVIIAALCLIGLLVTLNLIFRFPSFQPGWEEIGQFLG